MAPAADLKSVGVRPVARRRFEDWCAAQATSLFVVNFSPLRGVRIIFPVLAPFRNIVRKGHALMALFRAPGLLLMAPQAGEISLDRGSTMLSLDPIIIMRMKLMATLAEVQLFPAVTDETLGILALQLLHVRNILTFHLVASQRFVLLYPIAALVIGGVRVKLLPVTRWAKSAVN